MAINNNTTVIGRITEKVSDKLEIKEFSNANGATQKVVNCTIAVQDNFTKKVNYIDAVAYNAKAELIIKYLGTSEKAAFSGVIETKLVDRTVKVNGEPLEIDGKQITMAQKITKLKIEEIMLLEKSKTTVSENNHADELDPQL